MYLKLVAMATGGKNPLKHTIVYTMHCWLYALRISHIYSRNFKQSEHFCEKSCVLYAKKYNELGGRGGIYFIA